MAVPELQSNRPRHEQLSDWLRDQIEGGTYEPDDQLPSEKELCDLFGVSRITVRRALQTLENEELIYRRQGLGSFVSAPPLPQGLVRLTDFAQDMERAGLEPSSRVLFHGTDKASPRAARALGVEAGSTVIRLDRLRLADGEPIALDHTWLPPFYAQLLQDHDLGRETIYRVLEQEHDIPVLRGHYRIEAAIAGTRESELLEVVEGAPLLLIERTSYTTGDRPVYYQRRSYRSDRVAFDLDLARDEEASYADHERPEGMPLREFEPTFKGSDRPEEQ